MLFLRISCSAVSCARTFVIGATAQTRLRKEYQMQSDLINKDGPIKKFYLVKQYGAALASAGYDAKKMSCKEIEELLREWEERT
jgi:hypothetical protein